MTVSPACLSAWQQGRAEVQLALTSGFYHSKWGVAGEEDGISFPWNASIAFVHIGKAGGGTISSTLTLAGIIHDQQHMRSAECRIDSPFMRHQVFVVSVRDPVDRFISAYNWRGVHGSRNSTFLKCGSANSMFSSEAAPTNANCRRFKELVLAQPSVMPGETFNLEEAKLFAPFHEFRGYCFHLGGCMDALRLRRIMPIRTEKMDDDLNAALEILPHPRHKFAKIHYVYHQSEEDKFLSRLARKALEIALADEYRLVNSIFAMAGVNASYCTVEASLEGVCRSAPPLL
jgi:hypothetical protein